MRIVDGEVHEGDVLTYDCRVMHGYGTEYQVTVTVLAVKGDRARIEYRRPTGATVRRWVESRFLYRKQD